MAVVLHLGRQRCGRWGDEGARPTMLLAVFMIRTAISPRLATSSLEIRPVSAALVAMPRAPTALWRMVRWRVETVNRHTREVRIGPYAGAAASEWVAVRM